MCEARLPEHVLSNIEVMNPWDLAIIDASNDLRIYPMSFVYEEEEIPFEDDEEEEVIN